MFFELANVAENVCDEVEWHFAVVPSQSNAAYSLNIKNIHFREKISLIMTTGRSPGNREFVLRHKVISRDSSVLSVNKEYR